MLKKIVRWIQIKCEILFLNWCIKDFSKDYRKDRISLEMYDLCVACCINEIGDLEEELGII